MVPLSGNLKELTSIRAFAALVVVIFHLTFSEASPPGLANNLIADGHLGVDLFFMLSGFILTHVYVQSWRDGSFSYAKFMTNRIARVYPLHLTIIGLFMLSYGAVAMLGINSAAEGRNWAHLPWHVLLLHAWGFTDSHSWNFPSWSVSAEAFAYLFFPVSLWLVIRLRPMVSLVISVLVFFAASVFSLHVLDRPITKLMFDFGIIRVMTEFFLGMSIYLIMEKYRLPDPWIRPGAVISFIGFVALSAIQADERIIVLTMAVFLAMLAHLSTQSRTNFLRHQTMVYLGEISYATYMVHLLVILITRTVAPKIGITESLSINVLAVIGIYVLSAVLYHAIEHPGRILVRSVYTTTKNWRTQPKV